jgi:signal transduction histidine kinase
MSASSGGLLRRRRTLSYVPAHPDVSAGPVIAARRFGAWVLAAIGFLLVVGIATSPRIDPARSVLGLTIALLGGAALFLGPPRFLLLFAAIATAGITVCAHGRSSDIGWFAVCVVAGWCVLAGGVRVGVIFWAASLVLFGVEWLLPNEDSGWGSWLAGTTFTVLAVTLLRRQLDLVARLHAAQAALAERSRAEERNRIARELHDVIAHSLTVSLLHVSSARLAVEHDPADALRALIEAERLGRQSLDEVRAAVGLLRTGADEGIAVPVPGISDLTALIGQVRAAGVDVSMVLDAGAELPATVGSTVYRIVQEALTNAAKHAPGAHVAVRVVTRRRAVEVFVESDGAPGFGSGMGIANMRDRAAAVRGTCTAGPGGSGWLVHASVPGGATPREDNS